MKITIEREDSIERCVYESANQELLTLLPKDQFEEVMSQPYCDIDLDFLGFVATYKMLSYIIPKSYTVVDLGCAYNAQCFFFKDHFAYIGVDVEPDTKRFKSDNCTIYTGGIQKFIEEHGSNFNQGKTFAICNYVPNWYSKNMNLVKETFQNLYTYYPCAL